MKNFFFLIQPKYKKSRKPKPKKKKRDKEMKKWTLPVIDENFLIFVFTGDETKAPGKLLFSLEWKPNCTVRLEDLTPKELQALH